MKTPPTINARDLLALSPGEIATQLPIRVMVRYDDDRVVQSTRRALAYSSYFWEFHRRYPQLELLPEHHVDTVLRGQMNSSSTHVELLQFLAQELILRHGLSDHDSKEAVQSLLYEVTNTIYNEAPRLASRWVPTIDITHIIALADDPEVIEMRRNCEQTAKGIQDFYAAAYKKFTESPSFANNPLIKFIRMKLLNQNQVNQCVLLRGNPIEVTGVILSTPIMTNFVYGMSTLYDLAAESRSAAKHLYSAEAPLQDSEYFARRLQLASVGLRGLVLGDCGSKKYYEWTVKGPTYTESGRETYPGDLKFLKGKFYLDEETGKLKEITTKDKHLYNRIIKLRSGIHCAHPDPAYICSTCFGTLSHNVSRYANLGHLSCATLTQQTTQTILGTKHVIGSGVGSEVLISEDGRRYFYFDNPSMSFRVNPGLKMKSLKIKVAREAVVGLTDLRNIEEFDNISPKRLSSIAAVGVVETFATGHEMTTTIRINQGSRLGYFTMEFLRYVKEQAWESDVNGNFIFDMAKWDPLQPFVKVPDMEYSYSEHSDQIASAIESRVEDMRERATPGAPTKLVQDLFDLINSKLNVHLSVVECIVYANMTPSATDFGMARNVENAGLNVASVLIPNRSLGPAYVYESQFKTFTNPRSFFKGNRPPSPLDVLICPKEVVEGLKKSSVQQHF